MGRFGIISCIPVQEPDSLKRRTINPMLQKSFQSAGRTEKAEESREMSCRGVLAYRQLFGWWNTACRQRFETMDMAIISSFPRNESNACAIVRGGRFMRLTDNGGRAARAFLGLKCCPMPKTNTNDFCTLAAGYNHRSYSHSVPAFSAGQSLWLQSLSPRTARIITNQAR